MKQRRIDPEKEMKRFGARIPAELHKILHREALKRDLSLSFLVEEILTEWVEKNVNNSD